MSNHHASLEIAEEEEKEEKRKGMITAETITISNNNVHTIMKAIEEEGEEEVQGKNGEQQPQQPQQQRKVSISKFEEPSTRSLRQRAKKIDYRSTDE